MHMHPPASIHSDHSPVPAFFSGGPSYGHHEHWSIDSATSNGGIAPIGTPFHARPGHRPGRLRDVFASYRARTWSTASIKRGAETYRSSNASREPHVRCGCGHAFRCRARYSAQYGAVSQDRKSTRLNSSHVKISYAVFCLKKK